MAEVKSISEIIESTSPYYQKKNEPECTHVLTYDSGVESIEPIYFFILDLMNDLGIPPEKLIDNFSSTPGSSHFTETGLKAQRIQDEASKLLATAGALLRSVLNIVYDLKEYKIRLQSYDDAKSKDKNIKEGAILSLKQIWMDKVDILKGNTSIKGLALGQAGYQTLIDAFLIAKDASLKGSDGKEMDLNDTVKRILKPRIHEFNIWVDQSEKELRKRFEIERTYLKSQVNNLKLYSRWAKPYLRAAQKLEMRETGRDASIVNLFNTVRIEITLLGKSELKPDELALAGVLPSEFKRMHERKQIKRRYYSCVLVEFKFTAIPQQGRFTGNSTVTFKGYALNEDEIKKLDYELEKSDIGDVLNLIEGSTTESLEQLQADIDEFIEDKIKKEKEDKTSKDQSNPFFALLGIYNKNEKKEGKKNDKEKGEKEDRSLPVTPDSWLEKEHLRKVAASKAKDSCFNVFDIYKKSHGMPSYT